MPPGRHSSRIETLELKAEIISKIGNEKAEKYFYYLNKLFGLKISKSEFNKRCIGTIGKENLTLHNRFIESIVRNASVAKNPPPPAKGSKSEGSVKVANGYHRSNLQLLYGDAFPLSPRKGRSSSLRDRRFRDRPSPLGPNGKVHNLVYDETISKSQEKKNAAELVSPSSKPRLEVVSVEDGEEVEQVACSPCVQSRSCVSAPLGIQMNNGGGVRKTLCTSFLSSFRHESMSDTYELPDTLSLRKQLERKLETEGLSISSDCANLLNIGLDTFLKRMITPCLELARSRNGTGNECSKQGNSNSNSIPLGNGLCKQKSQCVSASLLDFQVAMELKPTLLGEYWPVQLERVCLRGSEE